MCPLHPVWEEAREGLSHVLAQGTLASVAAVDAQLEADAYPVLAESHRLQAGKESTPKTNRSQ